MRLKRTHEPKANTKFKMSRPSTDADRAATTEHGDAPKRDALGRTTPATRSSQIARARRRRTRRARARGRGERSTKGRAIRLSREHARANDANDARRARRRVNDGRRVEGDEDARDGDDARDDDADDDDDEEEEEDDAKRDDDDEDDETKRDDDESGRRRGERERVG